MITTASVSVTLAGLPCVLPDAGRFPAVGLASSWWCPLGPTPGRGWVAMLREHLTPLLTDPPATVALQFTASYVDGTVESVTFPGLIVERTQRVSPGPGGAPLSLHLVELTDKRVLVDRFSDTGNIQFNLRSFAQSAAYLQGTQGATWSSACEALWNTMQGILGPFPGLPTSNIPSQPPENLRYTGTNAWRALNRLLEKLSCAVRYDPQADQFTIVPLGQSQTDYQDALATQIATLVEEPLENTRTKFPQKIRVYFPKRPRATGQERDTELANNWLVDQHSVWVDIPTNLSGVTPGSVLPLWDDLPLVLNEDQQPENQTAIEQRANHRAQRWLQAQQTSGIRQRLVLPRLFGSIAPGSQVKSVRWKVAGPNPERGACWTEIVCHPGLPNAFSAGRSRSPGSIRGRRTGSAQAALPARMDETPHEFANDDLLLDETTTDDLLAVDPYQPQHTAIASGDENFVSPGTTRQIPPGFPRVANIVEVRHAGIASGEPVEANLDGLHPGVVRRWIAGELATLDPCWIRFVDQHDDLAGQVSARNHDCYGPGRLCGIETSQSETRPLYLVRRGDDGATIKFARSTGANQTQPTFANGRMGLVEVQPIDDPSGTPSAGAVPIMLAVVGRSGTSYASGLEEPRFYLPAGSKLAYVESTAHSGAVGIVVSDTDEREQFNLYWGKVRDLQGEAEIRDSGHFALPKQVRVDLLRRDTGAIATTAPSPWVMIPAGFKPKPGGILCFRHQDGLRDGSINTAVSDQNWGQANWENGIFVAMNTTTLDDDCGEFGCGIAVGTELPRANSTGVLRMFRGRRPDGNASLSKTNRPPRELQLGHGMLGLAGSFGTSRWLLPGIPYADLMQPGGGWWTSTSGASMPPLVRTTRTRRHLVSRRITQSGNAVELDWSPPGWTGYLYLMGTLGPEASNTGTMTRYMLRIYDGLVIGGGFSGSLATGQNMSEWSPNFATPLSPDTVGGDPLTEFDGGCCPKYDQANDVTQGP